MPALLGYLVAIAVFLGGGYAGLEWLTSPESSRAYHSPADKLATRPKNSQRRSSAELHVADEGGAQAHN